MTKLKAFVDTTIITDILLKPSDKGKVAKTALGRFGETLLPVYAIKEFKAGPLANFRWIHNKLVTTDSFGDTLGALQSMSMSLRRYTTSTAIEALKEAVNATLKGRITNKSLVDKYGSQASPDKTLCDMFRLSIRTSVMKGWKRRRNVTTSVILPLSCYTEKDPYEHKGLLELDPMKCKPPRECCLAPLLQKKNSDLRKLFDAMKTLTGKTEGDRRHRVLHELSRKPKALVPEEYCRGLGDAYFALFCPTDATILTTNIKDHKPLAESLGKTAELPD